MSCLSDKFLAFDFMIIMISFKSRWLKLLNHAFKMKKIIVQRWLKLNKISSFAFVKPNHNTHGAEINWDCIWGKFLHACSNSFHWILFPFFVEKWQCYLNYETISDDLSGELNVWLGKVYLVNDCWKWTYYCSIYMPQNMISLHLWSSLFEFCVAYPTFSCWKMIKVLLLL